MDGTTWTVTGYTCCIHCVDDPLYHADELPDTHDTYCQLCVYLRGYREARS